MASSAEPPRPATPAALGLDPALAAAGLNLAAVLCREAFDARVPDAWQSQILLPSARSVVVIGSGGDAFYRAARVARPASAHPLDEFCEALLAEAVQTLEAAGHATRALFYWERRGARDGEPGQFADFVALARAAGLGASSRLGLLLHPRYGPWFAIRALLLSESLLPAGGAADASFDPCASCPAPCIAACPGHAVSRGPFLGEACARSRAERSACAERCDARLACPVGAGHRYEAEALSHHATRSFRGVA